MAQSAGGSGSGQGTGQTSQKAPVRYGRKIALSEEELRTISTAQAARLRRRRSRLWFFVPVAIVLIAVAAIFSYVFVLPMFEGGNTPEEALEDFFVAFDEERAEDVLDITTLRYAPQVIRDSEIAAMEEQWRTTSPFQITVNFMTTVEYDDLVASIQADLDVIVEEVESMYEVDVKDVCVVNFNITTVYISEEYTTDGGLPLVKIGSNWYVAITPSMMPW